MRLWGLRRALLVVSVFALALAGGAAAGEDERGIDPNQGESLVEVTLANKAAAVELQLEADSYGIDFNEHYLRKNANGTVTVTVFGAEEAETRAEAAALGTAFATPAPGGEIVVLRVDYFENYDGRFLSVEAMDRLGGSTATGSTYTGPTLSLSWNTGPDTAIASGPRTMSVNIDPDTSPDTYIEHRELVRIGEAGSTSPGRPTMIRIGSSTGESVDAPVDIWLGGGLPPMSSTFLKDFTTRYMDPTEVYGRFADLAAEFPNIAELVPLPYKTNGYQRKAQANLSGTTAPGNTPSGGTAQSQTVVLTSRAWGHEGGNDITAAFQNPGVPSSPLAVVVTGNDIVVSLGTNALGALSSTAAQVVSAVNADPLARQLVVALTYRGNAGAGIVQPR